MTLRAAVAAALLAHALPALAQFEGIADVKMSGEEAGGAMSAKGKLYLSPAGWRMEMDMVVPQAGGRPGTGKAAGGEPYRVVTFGKKSAPGKSWMLNERTKTYAVVEHDEEGAGELEDADWKVTPLGQDRVAGFSCTNVRAERAGEDDVYEACLAKEFLAGSWLEEMRQGEHEWWEAAARKAGVAGYPVRLVTRSKGGKERHRFEVVKVERKRIAASYFEVPAGYREGSMMDVMAQTPEQQQQMQEAQRRAAEAMKNMSPEQKKMMEEMMKKLGGGQRQ